MEEILFESVDICSYVKCIAILGDDFIFFDSVEFKAIFSLSYNILTD